MRIYLDVSFPLPTDRHSFTYHYDLPESESPPQIGCRVAAPLIRRKALGYITSITETKPDFSTVSIAEVMDPIPLFPEHLTKLGFWISQTCFCSPGEAFHAMLPAGIKGRIERIVGILPRAKSDLAAGVELHPALIMLCEKNKSSWKFLEKKYSIQLSRLKQWIENGWVELRQVSSGRAGPKIQSELFLPTDTRLDISELSSKEKQVVEYFLKTNAAATMAQLCKATKVSSSPIKNLLKKGLLLSRDTRVFREVAGESYYSSPPVSMPNLTSEQEEILRMLKTSAATDRKPILLRGVTCSGKTEVYMRWIADELLRGKGAIVLVPEISLTPQMTKRFRDRFGNNVAILHSKLSNGERFDQWESIRMKKARVVVGARSAVFAPVADLGTIVIDEEGEPTFKQSESPRYHAREVALKRCELENAQLIMGSATPTMDSFQRALEGTFSLAEMTKRVEDRPHPIVEVVDMRTELVTKGNRSMFSEALTKAVKTTLVARKQTILYLNRRGYSSFIICRACGESVECSRCKVSLVYHSGCQILRCHYCGEARNIPKICPVCESKAIKFFGAGTERVEAEAKRYFPSARIARMDSDSIGPKGNLEDILERFGRGDIDILVGTQMVAKGLDFPNVTLVGILAADSLLRLPDFRAAERNFSLLAQVSGRAGRGEDPGRVVLQTYYPGHHSIVYALTEDYRGFFEEEAKHRKSAGFPPYLHLISFLIVSDSKEKALEAGNKLRELLIIDGQIPQQLIWGPSPSPIEKINLQFRMQLLVKSHDLSEAERTITRMLPRFRFPGVKIAIDVDPFFCL